jgi:hypothetical protein
MTLSGLVHKTFVHGRLAYDLALQDGFTGLHLRDNSCVQCVVNWVELCGLEFATTSVSLVIVESL